jgi:N-acetylmuramic acid 6-phosphate (MurNAc-6-P) etherase
MLLFSKLLIKGKLKDTLLMIKITEQPGNYNTIYFGRIKKCKENNIDTGCIVSNPDSLIAQHVHFPVEVITGPEFISGSARMKCGTAQKNNL